MKDASKNIRFYEKFKAMLTQNSLLEAHIQGVPPDEDVQMLSPRSGNNDPSREETSPSGSRTVNEK